MRKNKPGSDSSPAQATVIIPAHNEASVIDRCLGSIYNSIKPGEFEVIVVCNGCTDDTAKVVATRFPLVKLLETPIASNEKLQRFCLPQTITGVALTQGVTYRAV